MITKSVRLIYSIVQFLKCKIVYRNRIKLSVINSIRGKFRVELQKNSKMQIGKFLMTRGPFYMKGVNGGKTYIGDNCFFNHNVSITCAEEIKIGNNCMFANNLVIVDHDHLRDGQGVQSTLVSSPIRIGDNIWCGANVTILKGVNIGNGAVIAAGAVVTKNVEPHSVVAGVPAKKIGVNV